MALINRVARLFKADFHAVLDQIEEPELLLKQAVREMEDELAESGQRIRVCAHDQQALAIRKVEIDSKLAQLDEELDLCFASQKHDLARNLIRKKLEAQRLSQRLGSKHGAAEKYLEEQRAMLDENRATLEGLRQKAELFAHAVWRVGGKLHLPVIFPLDDNRLEGPSRAPVDLHDGPARGGCEPDLRAFSVLEDRLTEFDAIPLLNEQCRTQAMVIHSQQGNGRDLRAIRDDLFGFTADRDVQSFPNAESHRQWVQ